MNILSCCQHYPFDHNHPLGTRKPWLRKERWRSKGWRRVWWKTKWTLSWTPDSSQRWLGRDYNEFLIRTSTLQSSLLISGRRFWTRISCGFSSDPRVVALPRGARGKSRAPAGWQSKSFVSIVMNIIIFQADTCTFCLSNMETYRSEEYEQLVRSWPIMKPNHHCQKLS